MYIFFKVRIREKQTRCKQQMKKFVEVRTRIGEMEEELILKRQEVLFLRDELKEERIFRQACQNRAFNAESANSSLKNYSEVLEQQKKTESQQKGKRVRILLKLLAAEYSSSSTEEFYSAESNSQGSEVSSLEN